MEKLIETKDFATVTTSQLPSRVSETIVAAAVEQLKEAGVMRKHVWVDKSPSEEINKVISGASLDIL